MHWKLKIDELIALQLVEEMGSFSRAGYAIGRRGEVISKRIASLEKKLGVPLVARASAPLTLTPIGVTFLRRVADILDDLDKATREARGLSVDGGRTPLPPRPKRLRRKASVKD